MSNNTNEPTICRYGHTYTDSSFQWRVNRGNGARYKYCLVCPSDLAARIAQPVARPDSPRVRPPRAEVVSHCQRGHEFTQGNTVLRENNGRPRRECLTCRPHRLKAMREGYQGAALKARVDELVAAADSRRALIAARARK